MKRIFTVLAATLLLTAAMAMTASASDFDAVAKDLSAIGMFHGTGDSFELDRAPTRSEAAIMLVRLYGAEDAAKTAYEAKEITHPFTDVGDTVAPYVAWLYTNGLTKGATETTFNSTGRCSDQMYCSFLLRALGYEDGTDFTYDTALTAAQERGFYDPAMFSGEFLRDDLAAVTYQALAADKKDGATYLLDSLVTSGAIDKAAAAPMTEKIETYRALAAVEKEYTDARSMDMDIDMKMDMTMPVEGRQVTTTSSTTGNMKMAVDGSAVQLACEMDIDVDGAVTKSGVWMKDGWMYMNMELTETPVQYKFKVDDQLAALEEQVGSVVPAQMNASGLAMLDSLSVKKSGSDTVYTMVIGKGMSGYLAGVKDLLGDAMEMDFGTITAVYTMSGKGQLKSIQMVFGMDAKMDLDGSGTLSEVSYDYDMTMTVNAMGGGVKITYPDFSGYLDFDPSQVPGEAA